MLPPGCSTTGEWVADRDGGAAVSGTVRARVVVSGRVQGVWFRQSVAASARDHGVAGWVRNDADGSVEAVLEGDRGDVEQVVEYMRTGPSRADVRSYAVTWEEPCGETGFSIRG